MFLSKFVHSITPPPPSSSSSSSSSPTPDPGTFHLIESSLRTWSTSLALIQHITHKLHTTHTHITLLSIEQSHQQLNHVLTSTSRHIHFLDAHSDPVGIHPTSTSASPSDSTWASLSRITCMHDIDTFTSTMISHLQPSSILIIPHLNALLLRFSPRIIYHLITSWISHGIIIITCLLTDSYPITNPIRYHLRYLSTSILTCHSSTSTSILSEIWYGLKRASGKMSTGVEGVAWDETHTYLKSMPITGKIGRERPTDPLSTIMHTTSLDEKQPTSTFNLTLTQRQREIKAAVVLPHVHQGVFHVKDDGEDEAIDLGDDIDEEDPDDDLGI